MDAIQPNQQLIQIIINLCIRGRKESHPRKEFKKKDLKKRISTKYCKKLKRNYQLPRKIQRFWLDWLTILSICRVIFIA